MASSFRPNPYIKMKSRGRVLVPDTPAPAPTADPEEAVTEGLHSVPVPLPTTTPPASYKLVRLKPSTLYPHVSPRRSNKLKHTAKRGVRRWICWYIPMVAGGLFLAYALAELFMKHLAFKSAQAQWRSMPVTVEELPLAPRVPSQVPSAPRHTEPPPPPLVPSLPLPTLSVERSAVPVAESLHLPQMEFSAVPTEMAASHRNMQRPLVVPGVPEDRQSQFTLEYLQQSEVGRLKP